MFSVIFDLSVSLVFTFLYRLKHLNDHSPFVVSIFWSCSHFSFLYIHLPAEDIWSCTLGCSRVLAVPSPLPVCSEWLLTPHYIFITPIWYWWFETSLHWKVTKGLLHSSWQLLPIYPERGKIPIIGPVAPFQHFLSENCHSSLRVFFIPLLSISSLLEWNFATYLSLLYQQLNTCCPAVPSLLQHSAEEWETVPSPWSPAMKCFSSVPVLARKVLQKPCCVFFTVPFWPARVFCMAGYCHVALKFCIKPRQKPEDHNGVKQVRREGRQKTHGRNAAVTGTSWHSFWRQLCYSVCWTQNQSTAGSGPEFTFPAVPRAHSHKEKNRVCRCAQPPVKALAARLGLCRCPALDQWQLLAASLRGAALLRLTDQAWGQRSGFCPAGEPPKPLL